MPKVYQIVKERICESSDQDGPILLYSAPDKSELRALADNYKLDEHTLNSSLDPDEISRLEFEPSHIALIIKRPRNYSFVDDLLFKVTSMGLFVFKDKILIVMPEDIQIFEQESRPSMKLRTMTDVLLKIIYGTISHFLWHLKTINQISDSLEQKINTSMENRYLLNMFTLEKSLVYYLNGITYNSMLFEKMKINAVKIGFTPEELEILDDIIIENNQCSKQAEIYTNILSGLMDARASIVNNNLSLLIKRLTIISVVFLPLNFFASVGGMSEFTMMTRAIPWWVSYPIFTAVMIVIALFTYFFVSKIGFENRVRRERKKLVKPAAKPSPPARP
jgi:magnesium transporter